MLTFEIIFSLVVLYFYGGHLFIFINLAHTLIKDLSIYRSNKAHLFEYIHLIALGYFVLLGFIICFVIMFYLFYSPIFEFFAELIDWSPWNTLRYLFGTAVPEIPIELDYIKSYVRVQYFTDTLYNLNASKNALVIRIFVLMNISFCIFFFLPLLGFIKIDKNTIKLRASEIYRLCVVIGFLGAGSIIIFGIFAFV